MSIAEFELIAFQPMAADDDEHGAARTFCSFSHTGNAAQEIVVETLSSENSCRCEFTVFENLLTQYNLSVFVRVAMYVRPVSIEKCPRVLRKVSASYEMLLANLVKRYSLLSPARFDLHRGP